MLKMSPTKIKISDTSKENRVFGLVQCGSSIRTRPRRSGIIIRSRRIEYLVKSKDEQVQGLVQG